MGIILIFVFLIFLKEKKNIKLDREVEENMGRVKTWLKYMKKLIKKVFMQEKTIQQEQNNTSNNYWCIFQIVVALKIN